MNQLDSSPRAPYAGTNHPAHTGLGKSPLLHAAASLPSFEQQLQEFIRQPSVSSDPACRRDLRGCARWLASHLREIGIASTKVVETGGHPAVVGRIDVDPRRPTLLIYGHYDVQPVKPESEWRYPPFSGRIADGYIFGRGAADDKGQLFAHVKALESWIKTKGSPPCNVRILFEGEEEIGSPHLRDLLSKRRSDFVADGAVVSDTQMRGPGQPALTVGLRGKLAFDLILEGPRKDLHSGSFGGAIRNPLEALCELVTGFYNADGSLAIEGIYDDVAIRSSSSRRRLLLMAPSARELYEAAGVASGWGENGYSAYERVSTRPSLSVNGITGGHQGPGTKAIIPSRAVARLSFRLVPNQDPSRVADLLRRHIASRVPLDRGGQYPAFSATGLRCQIKFRESARPVKLDSNSPVISSAAEALRQTFKREPALLPSGGSIPIVETLQSMFGLQTALMGFALPTDGLHAPNEHFELKRFALAIEASIRMMDLFSKGGKRW